MLKVPDGDKYKIFGLYYYSKISAEGTARTFGDFNPFTYQELGAARAYHCVIEILGLEDEYKAFEQVAAEEEEARKIGDLVVSVQSRHGDLNIDAEALKTKLFGETRTFANTYRFTCKVEGRASNKAQTTYAVFHELYSIIESLELEAEYEQWVEKNFGEEFEPIL